MSCYKSLYVSYMSIIKLSMRHIHLCHVMKLLMCPICHALKLSMCHICHVIKLLICHICHVMKHSLRHIFHVINFLCVMYFMF